jgi:hypothetical protein
MLGRSSVSLDEPTEVGPELDVTTVEDVVLVFELVGAVPTPVVGVGEVVVPGAVVVVDVTPDPVVWAPVVGTVDVVVTTELVLVTVALVVALVDVTGPGPELESSEHPSVTLATALTNQTAEPNAEER